MLAIKIAANIIYAGLITVRAIHIGTAGVAILRVIVIPALYGIRIFYLRLRRFSMPLIIVKPDIAGHQRNKVGAGAAHDELVMIVAHSKILSQFLEYRRITFILLTIGVFIWVYIEKTHGFSTLEGMARYRTARKEVLATDAYSFINPDKKVVFAFICLLPHLEKTVHRIAEIGGDRRFFIGKLERTVRQVAGVTVVRNTSRQTCRIGCLRLRQSLIFAGFVWTD